MDYTWIRVLGIPTADWWSTEFTTIKALVGSLRDWSLFIANGGRSQKHFFYFVWPKVLGQTIVGSGN